jgi:hypothetical protein
VTNRKLGNIGLSDLKGGAPASFQKDVTSLDVMYLSGERLQKAVRK